METADEAPTQAAGRLYAARLHSRYDLAIAILFGLAIAVLSYVVPLLVGA
jgi:hypothetical protein